MASSIFMFNVVVTKMELMGLDEKDLKKLLVEVNFNNVVIPISASRMNSHDFKPEYEIGFKLDAMQIRDSLRCGLPISVKYRLKVFTLGSIHFDDDVVAEIGEGMDKLVLEKCCLFERHGQVIGSLGVKCSLRHKFYDTALVIERESRHSLDIYSMADQSMHEELCSPDSNVSTDPVEDSERLDLGVQWFARKDIWATLLQPSFYYNAICNAISCELKKMDVAGDKAGDSIGIGSGEQKPSKEPCSMPRNVRGVVGDAVDSAPSETKWTDVQSTGDHIGKHGKDRRKRADSHKRHQVNRQHHGEEPLQLEDSRMIDSNALAEQRSSTKNDSVEIESLKSTKPDLSSAGANRIENDSAQCREAKSSPRARKQRSHLVKTHLPVVTFLKFMLTETRGTKDFKKVKEILKASHEPVVNLCKRKGDLFITLRARRGAEDNMKPLSFKLVKNDRGEALSEMKRFFREYGFRKCTCRKPFPLCECHNIYEKTCIEELLQQECNRRGISEAMDRFVLSDTSDNEVDFNVDLSPPTGHARTKPRPTARPMNEKAIEIDLRSKTKKNISSDARSRRGYQLAIIPDGEPKVESMRSADRGRRRRGGTGNVFDSRHPPSEVNAARRRKRGIKKVANVGPALDLGGGDL